MSEAKFSIRLAVESDIEEICSFDLIAKRDERRREFIKRSVNENHCYVAVGEEIRGYAVLEYTFYETGFISMLYIHSDWRREHIGSALMKHLESICKTKKVFTSTNLSNLPMQALLAQLEYALSGVIYGLDEGDPELVYVKRLR